MIAWFARNSVAANLLMLTIVVAGLLSANSGIPLEIFPPINSNTIDVRMTLRGSSPEEAEQALAIRIEQELEGLEGIKQVVSRSVEGGTTVTVEIDGDYDAREILADIKTRVDAINTFPAEAERPVISLRLPRIGVLDVTLSGPLSELELREYADQVRNEMLELPGVTQVDLEGVRNYEVAIEVNQDRLRDLNLTLAEVATAVERSSLDLSGGNIRSRGSDILISSKGQAYHRDDFAAIVVKAHPDGSMLTLADVATIVDGFEETALRTRFNSMPGALLSVYRVGDQNAIEVAEQVKRYIEQKRPQLPRGLEISQWADSSQLIQKRLNLLISNAIQGGVLVLLLLTLFLRPAIAFWVFLGIPIALVGAFIFMPVLGVTINVISLFGFLLVLGIVVDDAIVTGENVYTHLRRGGDPLQAAIDGTREVSLPVTFGVLTTMVAFVPLAFIAGERGGWFAQMAFVVIPVLGFSLVESKLVLPSHLSKIKLRSQHEDNRFQRFQRRFADGFERLVETIYGPLLKRVLYYRYAVLTAFVALTMIVLVTLAKGITEFVFFPRIEGETVRASMTMPVGTPFEVTDAQVTRWVDAALQLKQKYTDPETGESVIRNVFSITGQGGGNAHVGRVDFEISPPEERVFDVTTTELLREWRNLIGVTPGAETVSFRAELGRGGDPIDVEFRSESLAQMEQAAELLKTYLEGFPEVSEISDSLNDGKQEIELNLKPEGHALGVTRSDLIRQVRQAFFGIEVQRFQRGRDDVRVMVRYPLRERETIADLQNMMIRTPAGNEVPLSHLATLSPGKSLATVYRIDGSRTINVRADVDKEKANMTVLQTSLNGYLADLVRQYPGMSYRLDGEFREQAESFASLKMGLLALLFAIYILLAVPFRSYGKPLIVMSIIPFGLMGAVVGHWIMGSPLTMFSVLGLLALVGILVNDSLVLVDFINQKLGSRYDPQQLVAAVHEAGIARFRAVFLTSATTFLGLAPMLIEQSTQAQFLKPMAISLGFGVLFATAVTLVMVPANYMIYEDVKALLRQLVGAVRGVVAQQRA